MNLKDQVCSLEHAKKLKSLNVRQETLFYWVREKSGHDWFAVPTGTYDWSEHPGYEDWERISAFTVAELGEIIGNQTSIFKHPKGWVAEHFLSNEQQVIDKNMCDALAKMLIYLLENNLISNEKNKRRILSST